ncbi:PLP-dependent aminotransferase family protein [Roseibium sp.]|uniref:MocR-like pyridoxine biosynthesis transcription factor PdxR n=1 Tax=Roseibium sp. TaxID=1936156 RepID=UPI003B509B1F
MPTDNGSTLQQQIQGVIVEAVFAGRFAPGEKMPSTRKLAEHLGVARITVTLAYEELVANGYLESKGRSGFFIAQDAPVQQRFKTKEPKCEAQIDWSRAIGQRFTGQAPVARPANWTDFTYPFIYGQSDSRLFDHHNWRSCVLEAAGRRDFETLATDYYERDDPMLVEFIHRKILPRRGIKAKPEEILITMGAQHALWIIAQILLTQRRIAVIENPCYPGLRQILERTRCNVVPVDVDSAGLPPGHLPAERDVVFTTPSHHCPTNATMPLERREKLLELATQESFIIVEDDYEFEISIPTPPSPALKSLDASGVVIYVGSFSKSIFPGLRLGYIVASEPFVHEARALRSIVLKHPPGLIQRTAAYFLSRGYYDAQISRMDRTYRKRRSLMEQSLREHGLFDAEQRTFGGSSFWLKTPNGIDSSKLALHLRQDRVLIEPGHPFFAKPDSETGFFRLAYSSIPSVRIEEGITLIAARVQKLQQ